MKLGKGKEMRVLTQQELKENLHYNSETGIFTWSRDSSRVKKGQTAGTKIREGYIAICVNAIQYRAHRLAWLYMTGEIPKDCIDHINGIRDDNRFNNLREATNAQNIHNQTKPHKNNKTGFLGVSKNKYYNKKYKATIKTGGILLCLGYFNTPEEAHEAYLKAKRELHPFCTV